MYLPRMSTNHHIQYFIMCCTGKIGIAHVQLCPAPKQIIWILCIKTEPVPDRGGGDAIYVQYIAVSGWVFMWEFGLFWDSV